MILLSVASGLFLSLTLHSTLEIVEIKIVEYLKLYLTLMLGAEETAYVKGLVTVFIVVLKDLGRAQEERSFQTCLIVKG